MVDHTHYTQLMRSHWYETLLRSSSTIVEVTDAETRAAVVRLVVAYAVEPCKPVMQPTSLPFTEQLNAAAVVASNDTGVASSSTDNPMSNGVMVMPHRLPAAIHAFKHMQTHAYTHRY